MPLVEVSRELRGASREENKAYENEKRKLTNHHLRVESAGLPPRLHFLLRLHRQQRPCCLPSRPSRREHRKNWEKEIERERERTSASLSLSLSRSLSPNPTLSKSESECFARSTFFSKKRLNEREKKTLSLFTLSLSHARPRLSFFLLPCQSSSLHVSVLPPLKTRTGKRTSSAPREAKKTTRVSPPS